MPRIKAFSDGVFAIAITLLILDIKAPPNIAPGQLSAALLKLWPYYLAFVTSFWTIGMMWINHHRVFALIKRSDDTLVVLNLLLLMGVTWVSFPTAVLAEHLRGPDQRIAAVVYSGTFLFIALMFNAILWYAIRRGHVSRETNPSHPITRQYAFGPIFYAALLAVGIVNAIACLLLSALLAIFFALPPKRAARVVSATGGVKPHEGVQGESYSSHYLRTHS